MCIKKDLTYWVLNTISKVNKMPIRSINDILDKIISSISDVSSSLGIAVQQEIEKGGLVCKDDIIMEIYELLSDIYGRSVDSSYIYDRIVEEVSKAMEMDKISEIESMRKLLDIMEKQLNGELNLEDASKLKTDAYEWSKDMQKLAKMLSAQND